MAEQRQITFTHKEVSEALIKYYGLGEGLWGLYIEFGISGANINTDPANPDNIFPAAIVPIVKLGIQRFDKPNSLTVDASSISSRSPKKNYQRRKLKKRPPLRSSGATNSVWTWITAPAESPNPPWRCWGRASGWSRPWPWYRTARPRGRTCAGRRIGWPSNHQSCSRPQAPGWAH